MAEETERREKCLKSSPSEERKPAKRKKKRKEKKIVDLGKLKSFNTHRNEMNK